MPVFDLNGKRVMSDKEFAQAQAEGRVTQVPLETIFFKECYRCRKRMGEAEAEHLADALDYLVEHSDLPFEGPIHCQGPRSVFTTDDRVVLCGTCIMRYIREEA